MPPYCGFSAAGFVVTGADVGAAEVGPVVVGRGAEVVAEGAHAARSSSRATMLPIAFFFTFYLPFNVVPVKEK